MIKYSFLLFPLFAFLAACNSPVQEVLPVSIIPQPESLVNGEGYYALTPKSSFYLSNGAIEFKESVEVILQQINTATGWDLSVQKGDAQSQGIIVTKVDMPNEAYTLDVNQSGINIAAGSNSGAFYALQSLLQLLPPDIYANKKVENVDWTVPAVQIKDGPRFGYRGMHLDVGRHIFPISYIKQYIDLIAMHKMNTFHWHLTEDQGWRIEIKKYPKLQTIAAYRDETIVGHYSDEPRTFTGERYGGFYTQEEAKEIVRYAAARNITVIPEIEMPGHAQAAIAAYPELGCTDKKVETFTIWGVSEEVFCPNEETFEFLEDVLDEVMAIFPSKYIHVGGDECPKNRWRESAFCQDLIRKENLKDEHGLQSYFIQRMEKYINSKGRQIIGWDEILEGGLAPNATVMSWRGEAGGIEAAKEGHDVVMTPTSHMYFDYYQSGHTDEPLAIGGLLTLEKVYSYDPIPKELSSAESNYILGVQGNLWTEYISTPEKANYMALPRMCAVSEVAWSSNQNKDWASFKDRTKHHLKRLDALGVDYSIAMFEPSLQKKILSDGQLEVTLSSPFPEIDLFYTKDGQLPTSNSTKYTGPVKLNEKANFVAAAIDNGKQLAHEVKVSFTPHLATGKTITVEPSASDNFPGEQGALTLADGIRGRIKFDGIHWLAWTGEDAVVNIDMGENADIQSVKVGCLKSNGAWIHLPKAISLKGGSSLEALKEIGSLNISEIDGLYPNVQFSDLKANVRYLQIALSHQDKIPRGLPGQDNAAWMFLDEIIVQ